NYARKVERDLPETPTVAVDVHAIKPRDWALSDDEMKAWWYSKREGGEIEQGVRTLGIVKRTWWLTCLFTGARRGSVEALKWADVDLNAKVVQFRVTKGDRPYGVPISDKLAEILKSYRDCGEVPPSQWVFPSPVGDGHLVDVRDDKRGVQSAHHLRHTFR